MAATASLRWEEELSRDQGKRTYLVTGAADIGEAYTAARTAAGSIWMNLKQFDAHVDDIKPVGGSEVLYFVSVMFGNPDAPGSRGKVAGDSTFSFDTTGGTHHITQAREHIASYSDGGAVSTPNSGELEVDKGKVKGIDIVIPIYKFSETHYLSAATVDATYKGILFSLTGRVNDASFKGLATGEGLFLGTRGSKRGAGDWEINFDFAGSPNLSGLVIGDITVTSAEGWFHISVEYEIDEDATLHYLFPTPKFAHVDRVYNYGDFGDLGIGT